MERNPEKAESAGPFLCQHCGGLVDVTIDLERRYRFWRCTRCGMNGANSTVPRATIPPAVPADVLQRLTWNGTPQELGDLFVLHKGSDHPTARCELMTHVLGWECRLLIGKELLQSKVCKSQDDVLSTGEEWKAAMIEKGWA